MTVYPSTPLPGSNPTQPLLELADVEAVLPPNVVVRWDEMLCEELVPALDKFYSPFKDFLAMMVREEEVVIRDSISSIFVDWLVDFKVCDLVLGGRWWKDLDIAGKLPFARDRVMELYFWILGVCYEPYYFFATRILIRVIGLLSITDDMYDASDATIKELVFFHDAIQRWEVNAPDQLPDYMKHFYQKILDTYKERSYLVEYAKSALKDMVRVYLIEAKWYHQGYVPSMEEYMPVAGLSGALRSLAIVSFVGMGELATN
ncbi:hypothetical protein RHGRI_034988 [Rhododendron griersonianum]|uniref:Terpene synthase metal-binding domain-containing protein n=1 Tax=Rhododendron griersonianum TaxID=479676 RepID=A0AAV6I3A2_9ERIC|nr:hypothetical protein RHGRI_034988 [Rhododendron griersonianum]